MTDSDRPVASLFDGVVGQPKAVEFLRASARQPVHAYLFCGPPGAGTRAAAAPFAAALLCPDGGCGSCETCRRVLAGTHPDLVVVERTGASLLIDDARRLATLAVRTPFEAARQVLLVPDVHLAMRSAPALLKTVEEPPATTFFILLAEDIPPDLSTVASRCVEVPFPPVPTEAIVHWLISEGTAPEAARLVADGSDGDVDRARLLARDPGFAARLERWRTLPARLDGSGTTASALAREVLEGAESALLPLRTRHEEELAQLGEEAKLLGERGIPGKKEVVDRQHREERRWRTDEIRAGLAVLARTYRDHVSDLVAENRDRSTPGQGVRGGLSAVGWITECTRALRRNPQESLLLEALFVRLSSVPS